MNGKSTRMSDGFKPIGEALDEVILTVGANCVHHRIQTGDIEGAADIRRRLQAKETEKQDRNAA